MGRNLNQIIAELPPERQKRIEARYQELRQEVEGLRRNVRPCGFTTSAKSSDTRRRPPQPKLGRAVVLRLPLDTAPGDPEREQRACRRQPPPELPVRYGRADRNGRPR
jgi:hypothetical protein